MAILDLRLPDQPGTQILEWIRAADDKVQVILYTAYGSFDSARDSVNLGAFAYLEKSSEPEELLRQVHRASRRWMKEALAKSQRRYRTLAEISPVGIYHADAGGRYRYVNQRWCEIAGLAAEEGLADGWTRGLDPEDSQRVLAQWSEAVAAGRDFSSEYRFRHADGKVVWGYALAKPEIDGGVEGYVGTITDISDRKRMEESLRLHQAAMEQAVLPVAFTTADPEDPRFVFANSAFQRLTGYSEEELLGESPDILNGSKTNRIELGHRRKAQREGKSFVGDLTTYRKGGAAFTMEWRIDPVRDDGGRLTHWVTILR